MNVPSHAWVLPKPSKSKYPGSFPLHFEQRLLKLLQLNEHAAIIQPFGGKAELGVKVDLARTVKPTIIADAHCLPLKDEAADLVILDPPYSNGYSTSLYSIKQQLSMKRYLTEALRVLKPGGFLVFYHLYPIPRPKNCSLHCRILLQTRIYHKLRWVGIFKKA
ncbi:MAG: class I SAM-dependent methyltransferase [Candidatus Bathyarchaeota archaeon]|nr:class I SAM-dependent methyltransferase [Candidatus Bathyarchaeota archaeon]